MGKFLPLYQYIEMHRELLLVEHVWTLLYLEFVHNSLLILYSASPSDILNLQSVGPVHYSLGTGAVFDDALYYNDVNDVACTGSICNKRISNAGPERSAGRPGHTPSRRELACGKLIEDRCAGQDWSAGRPGLTPFGASSAACPSPIRHA